MNTKTDKINLLNFHQAALRDFFVSLGEKPFRATQVLQWIHQYGVTDFQQMQNLSKSLRDKLQQQAEVRAPQIAYEHESRDGTRKWILRLDCGNCIETVFIPQKKRGTLCVSSQVGCALNCDFCSTGKQGFNRNLTVSEIIGQVWLAVRQLSKMEGRHDRTITNVVMMGMGEPLLNFEAVVPAMNLMMDDLAYGLSQYRVTLSTSGVVPAMKRLAECSQSKDPATALPAPVSLAVSLHAPNDALRDILVPVNKRYPLRELLAVCRDYYHAQPRRKVTFEYVMLAGINDSPAQAKELIKILNGIPAKVNLIPFNPFPGTQYRTSEKSVIKQFQDILQNAGIQTNTRLTRGDDIDGACGQLVGQVEEKTKRKRQWAAKMQDEIEAA